MDCIRRGSADGPVVVIVMPSAETHGGAEQSLLHLLRNPSGVRWHVAFLEDGPMVGLAIEAGVQAVVIPASRVRNPAKVVGAVRRIARLVRSLKAIAILSWMTKAHLYGRPSAFLALK